MGALRFFLFCCLALPLFGQTTLSTILENKTLRVCIWPEYYGISYVNPRTQELEGIDIDLAKTLAKDLAVNVEFVQSSFATLIKDVSSKRCDIAMFAIGHNDQRKAHLALTSPHLASDVYAITTRTNPRIQTWEDIDKEGVVVAVAKGTIHEPIMKAKLNHATLLTLDSLHAREREVRAGRADVFMTDYPFGMRMLKERDWAKLIKPTNPFHATPYGWAIAKDASAFSARVEAFIRAIKRDGRLEAAAKRHDLTPIVVLE